jgi:hypothetical protein
MLRVLRHGRTGIARVLLTLAFIAIAMKAVVPPGYMVAASAAGHGPVVVLCSGHQAYVDVATGEVIYGEPGKPGDDSKRGSDAPCLFAAAAPWGPPALAPHITPAQASADNAIPTAWTASLKNDRDASRPWATGPPLSA